MPAGCQHLAATSPRLLSIEGTAPVIGKTLFDVLLPVAASRAHH